MIDDLIRNALGNVDSAMPANTFDEIGRRLGLEFDTLDEPVAIPARPRAVRTRALVAAGIAVALAATTGGVLAIAHSGSAGTKVEVGATATTAPRSGQAEATDFAAQLLDRVVTPPGATVSTAPPPSILSKPPYSSAVDTLVDVHRLWTVPTSAHTAALFVQAHHAPGTTGGIGLGFDKTGSQTSLTIEQDVTSPPGDVIITAELLYGVTSTGPSTSLMRADALVVWGPEHPHIPAGDKVVTVSGVIETQSPKARIVVVTSAPQVAEIVTAFERSKVIPPGGRYNCPNSVTAPEVYTLNFAATRTAPPDVVVTVTDSGCRFATVKIAGRTAPQLMGYDLIAAAKAALKR